MAKRTNRGIPVSGSAFKHQRFVFRELQGRTIFEILGGSSILTRGEANA